MFRVKPVILVLASFVLAAGGAWAQAQGGARIRDRPLVVIDPGHGGRDPGAVSPVSGIAEKHVTLAVSRAIRDALLQGGRVRVAMTRNDDRFVPLHERVAVARRLGANLFVAVHGDSAPNPNASGATIYTLSEVASDAQAARLAAAENRRDGVDDVDLGVSDPSVRAILADLTQRETMNAAEKLLVDMLIPGEVMMFSLHAGWTTVSMSYFTPNGVQHTSLWRSDCENLADKIDYALELRADEEGRAEQIRVERVAKLKAELAALEQAA